MERKAAILRFLKARGRATLSEIASYLGLSKQGALRHLEALGTEGLVEFKSEERQGPGRREHVYRLAPGAQQRFPQAHRELAAELVHFMDPAQLEAFFQERADRMEEEYRRRLAGLGFEARVQELAQLATEKGHMAEVVKTAGGGLAIRQCNCPIADVAGEVGHPCHHEQQMYARLLGAEVRRQTFIPDHDPSCTYVVTPAPKAGERASNRRRSGRATQSSATQSK